MADPLPCPLQIASKDKDFRYMATSDLANELAKPTFRFESTATEKQVGDVDDQGVGRSEQRHQRPSQQMVRQQPPRSNNSYSVLKNSSGTTCSLKPHTPLPAACSLGLLVNKTRADLLQSDPPPPSWTA